ncbi:MAG: UDP-glucose/GDP-mannose dehydrogenase family protein [Rhodospirillales bacterium]|nr:UDP-glucose/GDP-mannose dehydrogenase family protein [Rhodospirillales bacterium]
MRVAVIGTGYVGLVTGACLAEAGHAVVCVDRDPTRVTAIASGRTPIHEAGLPELVARNVAAGRLSASLDVENTVADSELSLICVGTPSTEGRIDLSAVLSAAKQIGRGLRRRPGYHVVAVKSTVVPGTTDGPVRQAVEEASGRPVGAAFGLAMNPEFLSQGAAVDDFRRPDRIVIGEWDRRSGDAVAALYGGGACPILRTGLRDAEMIKYAANALQATLISFSNQIAAVCERLPGADEAVVMAGVHLDRGFAADAAGGRAPMVRFLRGGVGFGGSCFPKDLMALRHFAHDLGAPTTMIDAVIATNRSRAGQVVDLLAAELGGLAGRTVAVLGLAFKPDTDDLRESPGLALMRRLLDLGAAARGFDPLPAALEGAARSADRRAVLAASPEEALRNADAALIATAWPVFATWDWAKLATVMRRPLVFDGRGVLSGIRLPPWLQYRRVGVGYAHLQPRADVPEQRKGVA